MQNFKLIIELTRLNKPIGFMLLFWPCLWGLTLSYNFDLTLNVFIFYVLLFFSGSVLMRSAGCIVNDISDKNFDKLVERTKNRPVASSKISIRLAIIYAVVLCVIAFLVLINFNKLTIINELSLDLQKNCIVSIVGPSGSGKSTFLNIIGFESI